MVSLTLAFLATAFYVSAQNSISLFPIKFRLTINPGETYNDTITVINPSEEAIGVRVEVENLVGGEEGSIDLRDADVPYGLAAWVKIDRTSFVLQPQERRQIPFSITIPSNGEPGGYFGALLFRVVSAEKLQASGVGISGRVGSVILVEVPGEGFKTGVIELFDGPRFVSRGPASFSIKVKNTGNGHFDPTGVVKIEGLFIKEKEFAFEPRVVFPGYSRTYKVEWPFRYAFGPVKATAYVTIPDSGVQTQTISIFIFPWQEVGAVLGAILLLWFGVRGFKKRFKLVRVS